MRRNPCCSGIGIIRKDLILIEDEKICRNPCCSGIGIIRDKKKIKEFETAVS